MGLFDIFRTTDINEELKIMKETPGAVLLDVREVDEYEEEHIPDSVNIPLSNLEQINNMHYAKTHHYLCIVIVVEDLVQQS